MFFWFTEVRKSELINILFITSFSFNLVPAQNQIKIRNESSTIKIFENHFSKKTHKKPFWSMSCLINNSVYFSENRY